MLESHSQADPKHPNTPPTYSSPPVCSDNISLKPFEATKAHFFTQPSARRLAGRCWSIRNTWIQVS